MTWQSVPWMIGGGAEHGPEVGRLVAYAATSGAEGVVGIGDLKVSQAGTPGATVQHTSGAAIILNREAGGGQQSYIGRNPDAVTGIAIGSTGSGSGRSDLVIARVEDPQYSPWPTPGDVAVGPYIFTRVIPGVPAGTTTAAELNLGYPAIALARIDIPVSTSVITNAMIHDLRQMAQPRRQRDLHVVYPSTVVMNSSSYVNLASSPFAIPEWASRAKVVVTASGLALLTAAANGYLRVNLNGILSDTTLYDENWGGSYSRATYIAAGDLSVGAGIRGTTASIYLQGNRLSGSGTLQTDSGTTVIFDVEFFESAV